MLKKSIIGFVFLVSCTTCLFAEAVFQKDGSIIEGKIIRENDAVVSIKTDKGNIEIKRKDVLRTLYDDSYKKMSYVYPYDGAALEGYVVDEKVDTYTLRKKLDSPEEIVIQKGKVKFISKEKMDFGGDAKKIEGVGSASDRKYKFYNLLGFRVGAGYLRKEYTVENSDIEEDPFVGIGIYYYSRYFESDWALQFSFAEKSSMSQQFMMNFYPFNKFNAGLGVGFGYLMTNTGIANIKDGEANYNGILLGIMYRLDGWFRLCFYYSFCVDQSLDYNALSGGISFKNDGDGLPFNCHVIFEIFPWKNLSIMTSYQLTGADMNTDNVAATVKNADILVHIVSLYVCYGLNLF